MVINKEKIGMRVLNEWDCKVNECVRKRMASLKRKHINRSRTHNNYYKLKDSLEQLHNKYVLVLVDKAAQNVTVVCWKYYFQIVVEELVQLPLMKG